MAKFSSSPPDLADPAETCRCGSRRSQGHRVQSQEWWAHDCLGRTLHRQEKFLEAAAVYQKAIELPCKDTNCLLYNAACAAVLAGRGQGQDAATLSPADYARLRGQALAWLRADLVDWKKLFDKDPDSSQRSAQAMKRCQEDLDLASVRTPEGLAKLPESERRSGNRSGRKLKHENALSRGPVAPHSIKLNPHKPARTQPRPRQKEVGGLRVRPMQRPVSPSRQAKHSPAWQPPGGQSAPAGGVVFIIARTPRHLEM